MTGVTLEKRTTIRFFVIILIVLAVGFVGALIADKYMKAPDSDTADAVLPDFELAETATVTSSPEPVESETPTEPELPEETPVLSEPEETPEPEVVDEYVPLTGLPVRMRIPALSMDFEVQATGADKTGTMMIVPAREIISWFELSAIPGNRGNAIFGGHNRWKGVNSPLFTLDTLEIGEALEIDYDDGTTLRFLLESVFVYALKTAPAHLIMDVSGEPRLTLITCKGPFNTTTGTSDNRIVAIFREESIYVYPDPPIEKFPLKEVG